MFVRCAQAGCGRVVGQVKHVATSRWAAFCRHRVAWLLFPLIVLAADPTAVCEKIKHSYGEGFIVNIPMPEHQVLQVVQDAAQNGIIRGTKEFNKDEYVSGAKAANTSSVLPWNEGGTVLYKVREQALDPQNFKGHGDLGTLVVRYVVQAQGEKNTVLRIDSVFAETYHRTVDPSDGSVENAEYQDIRDHLESIRVMEQQDAEAAQEREQQRQKGQQIAATVPADDGSHFPINSGVAAKVTPPTPPVAEQTPVANQSSATQPFADQSPLASQPAPSGAPTGQSLEERVQELRRQLKRVVKSPGAPLKSAPFHTASNLQSLSTGTEVLILVSTPYWYGVETHDGQHGWVMRDQLEQQ